MILKPKKAGVQKKVKPGKKPWLGDKKRKKQNTETSSSSIVTIGSYSNLDPELLQQFRDEMRGLSYRMRIDQNGDIWFTGPRTNTTEQVNVPNHLNPPMPETPFELGSTAKVGFLSGLYGLSSFNIVQIYRVFDPLEAIVYGPKSDTTLVTKWVTANTAMTATKAKAIQPNVLEKMNIQLEPTIAAPLPTETVIKMVAKNTEPVIISPTWLHKGHKWVDKPQIPQIKAFYPTQVVAPLGSSTMPGIRTTVDMNPNLEDINLDLHWTHKMWFVVTVEWKLNTITQDALMGTLVVNTGHKIVDHFAVALFVRKKMNIYSFVLFGATVIGFEILIVHANSLQIIGFMVVNRVVDWAVPRLEQTTGLPMVMILVGTLSALNPYFPLRFALSSLFQSLLKEPINRLYENTLPNYRQPDEFLVIYVSDDPECIIKSQFDQIPSLEDCLWIDPLSGPNFLCHYAFEDTRLVRSIPRKGFCPIDKPKTKESNSRPWYKKLWHGIKHCIGRLSNSTDTGGTNVEKTKPNESESN